MTSKVSLNIFNARCAPLEHIKGKCEWNIESDSPTWLIVRLVCFSRLRHYATYRTFAPIEELKIAMPPSQGIIDFDFELPGFPYSFDGKLFTIGYAIEAEIDRGDKCQEIIESRPYS